MNDNQLLGIVQNGRFHVLPSKTASSDSFRLTSIQMQTARSPESNELDLAK